MSYGSEYGLKTPRRIVLCTQQFLSRTECNRSSCHWWCVCMGHVQLVRVTFCLAWCLWADRQSLPDFLWGGDSRQWVRLPYWPWEPQLGVGSSSGQTKPIEEDGDSPSKLVVMCPLHFSPCLVIRTFFFLVQTTKKPLSLALLIVVSWSKGTPTCRLPASLRNWPRRQRMLLASRKRSHTSSPK